GAVDVEGGDALRDGHEVRRAFLGHLRDEGEDGLLRAGVVPRRERVGRGLRGDSGGRGGCEQSECERGGGKRGAEHDGPPGWGNGRVARRVSGNRRTRQSPAESFTAAAIPPSPLVTSAPRCDAS